MINYNVQDATTVDPEVLLLYAQAKAGKTTAVSLLKGCLILDLEPRGTNFVSAMKHKVKNLDEYVKVIAQLKADKEKLGDKFPVKYIALDNISFLEDWCVLSATKTYMDDPKSGEFNKVVEKDAKGNVKLDAKGKKILKELPVEEWQTVLNLPNGAGYQFLREEVIKYVNLLLEVEIPLIILAHVKDKLQDSVGTDVNHKNIDLFGKLSGILAKNVDAIGFLYREDNDLHVTFETSQTVTCGARSPHIEGQDFVLVDSNKNNYWNKIYTKLK